ncbi:MAG: hypothetical protein PHT53_02330 [Candidatus Omnitrophica bacterium]|nr:hypothetical protein [Candidatus Omnitrophota bacterium]
MKKVIVIGGAGIGMIAASIINTLPDVELMGFLNDVVPVGQTQGKFKKIKVIGKSQDVHKFIKEYDAYVLMVYVGMKKEKERWEKLLSLNIPRSRFINIIHPSAQIPWEYCSIGNGVLMAPNVQLSPDTTISDNCILLGNSFVGHDSILKQYVSVANHASIGANVHIGRAVHIGSNATIKERVNIGEFSLIGMGSVVLNDVPPNTIVAGTPAKAIVSKS